mmetsp:Transcript_22995/g.46446  ORF Transcript_22995/g.46446 Transcript_22995/m.46446 type:complete len:208 (+) Transcript_22995:393-1016(+)
MVLACGWGEAGGVRACVMSVGNHAGTMLRSHRPSSSSCHGGKPKRDPQPPPPPAAADVLLLASAVVDEVVVVDAQGFEEGRVEAKKKLLAEEVLGLAVADVTARGAGSGQYLRIHGCCRAWEAVRRLSGSISKRREMRCFASGETSAYSGYVYLPALMAQPMSYDVGPMKGGLQHRRMNAITPTAHRSHSRPYPTLLSLAVSTSGAM